MTQEFCVGLIVLLQANPILGVNIIKYGIEAGKEQRKIMTDSRT